MNVQKNRMSKKHMIFMILGCVVPMTVIFILFVIGIPLNKILLLTLILLCPISHIFMMKSMMNHGNENHIVHYSETINKEIK